MEFQADRQHTEGAILGKKRWATVLPPALPEWQSADNPGRLRQQGCKLELTQTAVGAQPLRAAVHRSESPAIRQAADVAATDGCRIAGYSTAGEHRGLRVKIGKEQWLIYRSLSPKANRTLLGHNLSSEFLLARFLKNGEVESLIEVE